MKTNQFSELNLPIIALNPKKAATLLFYAVIILHFLNLAGIFFQKVLGYNSIFMPGLVTLFDVSEEYNVPSLFSTLILFTAAAACFLIYLIPDDKKPKFKKHWLILCFVFIFLSFDETLSIHEKFNKLQAYMPGTYSGYMKYTWILPYAAFAFLAGIFFFKFLLQLPYRTKKLFIFCGCLYVLATIAFEPIEGHIVETKGIAVSYFLFCSLEEFLEMSSIVLFIYALLDYASLFHPSIQITSLNKSRLAKNNDRKGNLIKAEPPKTGHLATE